MVNHYERMQQQDLANSPENSALLKELKKLKQVARQKNFEEGSAGKKALEKLQSFTRTKHDEVNMFKEWPVPLSVYMSEMYDALIAEGVQKAALCTCEGYNQIQ